MFRVLIFTALVTAGLSASYQHLDSETHLREAALADLSSLPANDDRYFRLWERGDETDCLVRTNIVSGTAEAMECHEAGVSRIARTRGVIGTRGGIILVDEAGNAIFEFVEGDGIAYESVESINLISLASID